MITKKQQRIGIVIANKTNKTIKVLILQRFQHKKYKKFLIRKKSLLVHSEKNNCNLGDVVLIESTKPISKRKNFTLKQILKKKI